jgi:hypothetical protein
MKTDKELNNIVRIKLLQMRTSCNGITTTPFEKSIIARKQQGLTPAQIADELNLPRNEVYKVLTKFIQEWD